MQPLIVEESYVTLPEFKLSCVIFFYQDTHVKWCYTLSP